MTMHVDNSQKFINLKLSLYILCSYFRFLLGFSKLYIPERFLVINSSSLTQSNSSPTLPPDPTFVSVPAFALRIDTKFYLSGAVHTVDSTSYLVCAWVQTLDDLILDSEIFSCPMIFPYNNVTELTFILYVLNSILLDSSVTFISLFKFDTLYLQWYDASPIKRTRLKNNILWSCISELMKSRRISCGFISFLKDSVPPHSTYTHDLIKKRNQNELLQPVPLIDVIFPSSLCSMGLFTGYNELITQDPVMYWRSLSDI